MKQHKFSVDYAKQLLKKIDEVARSMDTGAYKLDREQGGLSDNLDLARTMVEAETRKQAAGSLLERESPGAMESVEADLSTDEARTERLNHAIDKVLQKEGDFPLS